MTGFRDSTLNLLLHSVLQHFQRQRLSRVPEPATIMRGEERCRAFCEATDNENLVAAHDFCCDLLAAWGPREGRMLDVACGSGQLIFHVSNRLPGLSFTGLDASEDMLNLCQHRIQNEHLPRERFSFIVGEMSRLDTFPDHAFHAATWTYAAHHTSDLEKVRQTLREMNRVTHPDGILLVLDLGRLKTASLNEWYTQWAGRRYNDVMQTDFRDSMNAAYTADEIRTILDTPDMPSLEHYVLPAMPVLQFLVRPARGSLRGDGLLASPTPSRPPQVARAYRQVRQLFRMAGLDPARAGSPR